MSDVFAVQSEVAESVAQKLRIKLLPDLKERIDRRPTQNLEAYDLYLQGRYQMLRYSVDGWTKAVDCFTRATQVDPNFALAWAGLADAYAGTSSSITPPREAIPKIRDALARAMAIDDSLGAVHGALAYSVFYSFDWNWPEAEREFRRALELDPSNAQVHSEYAEFLNNLGRSEEALVQTQKANELDPLLGQTTLQFGMIYQNLRQYDRAVEYFDRAIEMEPGWALPYGARGMVRYLQKRYPEALSDFEKAASLGHAPLFDGWLAMGYGAVGRRSDVEKILSQVKATSAQRYIDPILFFQIYSALGDMDQAFEWLNKAYEDRSYFMTTLKFPEWDPLRSDPRFQAMYKKVGLPP